MKLSPNQEKALRKAVRKVSRAELKALFALVRTHDDRALLNVLAPAKKRAKRRRGDVLTQQLQTTLKPVLAPASEKAELLVEHLAKKHRRKLDIAPKGLADAARQLRAARFTDKQIAAGAEGLLARLAELYGARETVV